MSTLNTSTDTVPQPSLEWEITTRCNYHCTYCSQGTYQEALWTDASDETVEAVFRILENTREPWLVKVAGGEPFVHKSFIDICSKVASLSHRVCTTTNLSAPIPMLDRFLDATGSSLAYVTASLHPTEVANIESFLIKARHMMANKPPTADFTVTTVGVAEHFPVFSRVAEVCAEAGIPFEVAPLKEDGHFVDVGDAAFEQFMREHPLKNVERIRNMKLFGTVCHAGELFARINAEGDVMRCYNAQPRFYLGNVAEGTFRWLDGPKPCLAAECTCTVPANRNMIEFGNKVPASTLIADAAGAVADHGVDAVRFAAKWVKRGVKTRLKHKNSGGDPACLPLAELPVQKPGSAGE